MPRGKSTPGLPPLDEIDSGGFSHDSATVEEADLPQGSVVVELVERADRVHRYGDPEPPERGAARSMEDAIVRHCTRQDKVRDRVGSQQVLQRGPVEAIVPCLLNHELASRFHEVVLHIYDDDRCLASCELALPAVREALALVEVNHLDTTPGSLS